MLSKTTHLPCYIGKYCMVENHIFWCFHSIFCGFCSIKKHIFCPQTSPKNVGSIYNTEKWRYRWFSCLYCIFINKLVCPQKVKKSTISPFFPNPTEKLEWPDYISRPFVATALLPRRAEPLPRPVQPVDRQFRRCGWRRQQRITSLFVRLATALGRPARVAQDHAAHHWGLRGQAALQEGHAGTVEVS